MSKLGVGAIGIAVFAGVLTAFALPVEAQRLGQRSGGESQPSSQPSEGGSSPQSRPEPPARFTAPREAPAARSAPREQGQERPGLARRAAPAAEPASPRPTRLSGATETTPSTDAVAGARDEQSSAPRARGDGPITGRAVRGGHALPPSTVYPIYPGGYYPWGYGAFGFGAYYDGYWGPYDPWYGGYSSSGGYTGSIRLKVKPRGAAVYVDGFFVGIVDEFDGIFQRLPIEPGAYTIEIRADGYEPHTFDVRIVPDRTTTYEAELTPLR